MDVWCVVIQPTGTGRGSSVRPAPPNLHFVLVPALNTFTQQRTTECNLSWCIYSLPFPFVLSLVYVYSMLSLSCLCVLSFLCSVSPPSPLCTFVLLATSPLCTFAFHAIHHYAPLVFMHSIYPSPLRSFSFWECFPICLCLSLTNTNYHSQG